MNEVSIELNERSSLEISERSLALIAIVARSHKQEWVEDWVRQFEIHDYFSEGERIYFTEEQPSEQSVLNFSWKAEALVWSLGGLKQMPSLTDQFWVLNTDFIAGAMKAPNSFRLSATKRASEEIQEMEGFLYHQHWRVRDKQLGLNTSASHRLGPGEILVDDLNPSVVHERRYGISWVVGWGEDWDDVPTDT